MTHRSLAARLDRRTAVVAAASFATALTTLTQVGSAGAAEPPVAELACTPYDTDATIDSDVVKGMEVTGLTVSQGIEPEKFSGTVLGSIDDGIAPGVDMILARLSSAEINRVGVGIWRGMSGSPVYAPNGKLLGAVAYGLSFGPSTVAGITPASAMLEVAAGASAARSAEKVAIPASLQRTIVARTRVGARAADGGLSALKTPVGVSGVSGDKRLKTVKRTLGLTGVKMYRAAPAPAESGNPASIEAGGNLAVSLVYGDISVTGVGTVTAVCSGTVIGFGHPLTYDGPTELTMQSASAIYVQEDPVFGAFKVANATGTVGTITQDRLAGVAGPLGPVPAAVPITSTASVDEDSDGTAEDGNTARSYASAQQYVAGATFLTTLLNQDAVYDRYAPGSGRGHFTITGSTDDGEDFSLDRTNRYASRWDLSYEMADEAPSSVYRIYRNKFTDLTFDEVTVDSWMKPEPRLFQVGKVEQKLDGDWVRLPRYGVIVAKAGKTIKLRATLTSYRDRYGKKVERINVAVPEISGKRAFGYLVVGGGSRYGFSTRGADSLGELVSKLQNAPRNDELVTSMLLNVRRGPNIRTETSTPVGDVVSGGNFYELYIAQPGSGSGGGSECPEEKGC